MNTQLKLDDFFFQDGYSAGYFCDSSNYTRVMTAISLLGSDCIAGESYINGLVAGWKDANNNKEVKE